MTPVKLSCVNIGSKPVRYLYYRAPCVILTAHSPELKVRVCGVVVTKSILHPVLLLISVLAAANINLQLLPSTLGGTTTS